MLLISLILLAKVTLLLAVGSLALLVFRGISPASRHWLCVFTLLAMLLAPLIPAVSNFAPDGLVRVVASAASGALLPQAHKFEWLEIVWITGALLTILRFVVGRWRLAIQIRNSVPGREYPAIFPSPYHLANVTSPIVSGWLRPVILVPVDFPQWPFGRRRMAILHESAHIIRGDHWILLLFVLAKAVYWFHPLVWWLTRTAEQQREMACDDHVLKSGVQSTAYAELLVDLASRISSVELVACGIRSSKGSLRCRIEHILDFPRVRYSAMRSRFAIGVCLTGLLAGTALVPTLSCGSKTSRGQIYRVGQAGVTAPILLSKVEPSYTEQARGKKTQGTVLLALTVDAGGFPSDVRVRRSLDAGLDRNAIAALCKWRFRPATAAGKPVPVHATVEIDFAIK